MLVRADLISFVCVSAFVMRYVSCLVTKNFQADFLLTYKFLLPLTGKLGGQPTDRPTLSVVEMENSSYWKGGTTLERRRPSVPPPSLPEPTAGRPNDHRIAVRGLSYDVRRSFVALRMSSLGS